MNRITVLCGVFVTLYAAHQVADLWVQTQKQADTKHLPGWPGRRACAAHVTTYTVTGLVLLLVVGACTGLPLPAGHLTIGLGLSAASHYAADRRTPLRRIADRMGKSATWLDHGGGMYALDQSWHTGWLFAAALTIAAGAAP